MELTKEQREAVRGGESVRLNEEGTDLVVLRADVFERLRGLGYDDGLWSDEEMDQLAAEDADALGWERMEAYQNEEIAMIELTEQQRRELTVTDSPKILDPETGKTYVLVAIEVYEQLTRLLEDEPKVTGEMVDRLLEEEDGDDPTLAFYQQQYGRKL